jgi:hypothetical protein
MFQCQKQLSTITSVNLRNELHGDEHVGAVDIGITMSVPNSMLEMFNPDLVSTFYRGPVSGQIEIDGRLPDLKFADLAMPMKWSYVGAGYEVALDYGMNEDKQLTFIKCQVDKFKFDMKPGGQVDLSLRIIAHPKAEDVGELYELLGDEVDLTLIPPQPGTETDPQQTDLLDGDEATEAAAEPKAKGKKGKADAPVDALYKKAVAVVRATQNPDANAIALELKTDFNHAATLLARMLDEGVIEQDDAGQYVVAEMHEA